MAAGQERRALLDVSARQCLVDARQRQRLMSIGADSVTSAEDTPVAKLDGHPQARIRCLLLSGVALIGLSMCFVALHLATKPVGEVMPPRRPTVKITQSPTPAPMWTKRIGSPRTTWPPQQSTAGPTSEPLALSTSQPLPKSGPDFADVLRCAEKDSPGNTWLQRIAECSKSVVAGGFHLLGRAWGGYTKIDKYEERLSYDVARPLYHVGMAKALTSLCQISQCGPQDYVREWTCPACQEAGFEIVAGTHRFIQFEELNYANATFVIVARIQGMIPHRVRARLGESLRHHGEKCWRWCGASGGFCAWCGVGNACCGNEDSRDPIECKGIKHQWRFHTCVPATTDRSPAPVINKGRDCYNMCGQIGGYCNFCGAGNACCKKGVADAEECSGATGFTTDHFECVAPAPVQRGPPVSVNDTGCILVVRGSHNAQNGISNAEFVYSLLPFAQCEGCQVHLGFNTVWKSVHSKVVQTLDSLGCTPGTEMGRVIMTGESFGGSVATVGQYYLQASGFTMELQYNFGSPRVGNVAWAENFNRFFDRDVPLFRVTHAHDMVSRLPPIGFLNYRHVNSEVFYPGEDPEQYVVCMGGEDYECQNRYDIAECIGANLATYDLNGSLKATPGEAMDVDHCHTGLAPDGDMCQCPLSDWWTWYKQSGFLAHRWDSAPDNSGAPRLAPGAIIG